MRVRVRFRVRDGATRVRVGVRVGLPLLQATLDLLGQGFAVGKMVILAHVGLVRIERVHHHVGIAAKPPGWGGGARGGWGLGRRVIHS